MKSSIVSLWSLLEEKQLTTGTCPEDTELQSPWYIKVLMAFSGWLASIFLLGFVGLGFESILDNEFIMLIIGSFMIAGSAFLLQHPKNEFLEHLSLAISLAGQMLIIISLFELTNGKDAFSWLLVACLQAPLALFMPNYLHRFFSSFATIISLSISFSYFGLSHILVGVTMLISAWIWCNEFVYPKHIRKIQAIGYGLVIALIQQKVFILFGTMNLGIKSHRVQDVFWAQPWFGELLCGLSLVYVIRLLLKRSGHHLTDPLSLFTWVSVIVMTILSIKAQGLTLGIMILILGFAASNLVLQGLGVITLLSFISAYYYLLDNTLLDKSQTLLFVGLALLAIRWLFLHFVPNTDEVTNDE